MPQEYFCNGCGESAVCFSPVWGEDLFCNVVVASVRDATDDDDKKFCNGCFIEFRENSFVTVVTTEPQD